jgi:predicted O-methyltransferase YrrM
MLDPKLQAYLRGLHPSFDPTLDALHARAEGERFPIVGPEVGQLLFTLARAIGARTVWELGSGFGYSAWWFARAVGPLGTVHLTDTRPQHLADARSMLEEAGLWDRCVAHPGDALDTFTAWEGRADIVFCDIDKEDYPRVPELAAARLRAGGLLVFDNMLWSGRVYTGDPEDPATAGVLEATRQLWTDPAWSPTLIPLRDGVAVATKLQ